MMDNATNNNMLAEGIEQCSTEAGVHFFAMDSWMRCMLHTVHLAVLKVRVHTSAAHASKLKFLQLLEAIGTISNAERKKATSHSGNYQDNATAPVDRQFDDEAVQQEEDEDEDESSTLPSPPRSGRLQVNSRYQPGTPGKVQVKSRSGASQVCGLPGSPGGVQVESR